MIVQSRLHRFYDWWNVQTWIRDVQVRRGSVGAANDRSIGLEVHTDIHGCADPTYLGSLDCASPQTGCIVTLDLFLFVLFLEA